MLFVVFKYSDAQRSYAVACCLADMCSIDSSLNATSWAASRPSSRDCLFRKRSLLTRRSFISDSSRAIDIVSVCSVPASMGTLPPAADCLLLRGCDCAAAPLDPSVEPSAFEATMDEAPPDTPGASSIDDV